MGQIIKAKCLQCGFEKDIFAGGGRMDCNMDTILSALPKDEQNILSEAVKQGAIRLAIDRKPCSCASCGEIYTVPIVSYTLNNTDHELRGECPICGEKKSAPPDICSECGAELSLANAGLWD